MQQKFILDRNLALETARVTEATALACFPLIGRGLAKKADEAAVDAMRQALSTLDINGTIVIGEGERDKAPMLYIGEHVGTGSGPNVDVALDPLEGTDICANGGSNALAVVAIAEKGGFLNAPDVYMEKLAVGAGFPPDILDIEASPKQNIHNIAKAKKCDASEISAVILERPRHKELIAKVRETGARITLIDDGDVAGIIATTRWETGADVYMGIGGAPEGVLAAAALRSTGGQMQGRLIFEGDKIDASQKERAKRMGISDFNKIYTTEELATGDVMFSATGVTNGWMLSGVTKIKDKAYTETLVMRSRTKTIRRIKTEHNLNFKPI